MPDETGRRIAFFGGSFDPPHHGHLAIAAAARDALHLDQVLFAPVGTQPLKPRGSTADFADRLAMTRLAIAQEPAFAISMADAPSTAKPNYTIDTLLRLRGELSSNDALFCLIGADSFLGLRRWHRGAEIPFVAPLIVASRPGDIISDLAAALPEGISVDFTSGQSSGAGATELQTYTLHNAIGRSAPFYLLPDLQLDISASQIRSQVRATLGHPRPTSGYGPGLPSPVAHYILAHNLYR
ncbi:MAG TPA: nicotinate (nicotinamide) nucleotide adenylyltransferase [Terracidiphilus sp.]|nr:nicotinate (nicotinamide) nucleotide adenylyltransferase [Terracidiphilus sp.]